MKSVYKCFTVIILLILLPGETIAQFRVNVTPNPAQVGQEITVWIQMQNNGCRARVDFGDRSDEWESEMCSDSLCNLQATHTYRDSGEYTITAWPDCDSSDERNLTLTVKCLPLTISTRPALPPGSLDNAYSTQLNTSGGHGATFFQLVSGSLPPGLSLRNSGLIFGHPTSSGNFSFTIKATDSCRVDGAQETQKIFNLRISGSSASCVPLRIPTDSTLPRGHVRQLKPPYRVRIQATGGHSPISFRLYEGKLPPGLSLNDSGLLSGAPKKAGKYSFKIMVTDSCTVRRQTLIKHFNLEIDRLDKLKKIFKKPTVE